MLRSGATPDANLRDGHVALCGVQRRVNVRACGSLSLYIVLVATTVETSGSGPSKPGSVLPVRIRDRVKPKFAVASPLVRVLVPLPVACYAEERVQNATTSDL